MRAEIISIYRSMAVPYGAFGKYFWMNESGVPSLSAGHSLFAVSLSCTDLEYTYTLGPGLRWHDVKGYIMWLPVWHYVLVASVRLELCVSMALMSADRPRPRGSSVARPGWEPRALWLRDCPHFHCTALSWKGWWWKRMTPQGWEWAPWPWGIQGPARCSEQPVKDWVGREAGPLWRFLPWLPNRSMDLPFLSNSL